MELGTRKGESCVFGGWGWEGARLLLCSWSLCSCMLFQNSQKVEDRLAGLIMRFEPLMVLDEMDA